MYPGLVSNIWIIASLFWIILYGHITFILKRSLLLSKKDFAIIATLSLFITFIFNRLFYDFGLESLLPQNSIWFWVILFSFTISSLWYKHTTVVNDSDNRIQNYIQTLARKFEKEYKKILVDLKNSEKNLLLSILIVENYNRPQMIRIIERSMSYIGLAKTTGLAQISRKGLSDLESVKFLKDKIKQNQKVSNFNLDGIREFLKDYNGANYDEMVIAVLHNLEREREGKASSALTHL